MLNFRSGGYGTGNRRVWNSKFKEILSPAMAVDVVVSSVGWVVSGDFIDVEVVVVEMGFVLADFDATWLFSFEVEVDVVDLHPVLADFDARLSKKILESKFSTWKLKSQTFEIQ